MRFAATSVFAPPTAVFQARTAAMLPRSRLMPIPLNRPSADVSRGAPSLRPAVAGIAAPTTPTSESPASSCTSSDESHGVPSTALRRPPAVVGKAALSTAPRRPPAVAGKAGPSTAPRRPPADVGKAAPRTPTRPPPAVVGKAGPGMPTGRPPAVLGKAAPRTPTRRPPAVAGKAAPIEQARHTPAVAAAASAEEDDHKRQFAVAVPFRWTDADWMALLPWQSIAIAYLEQNPGNRRIQVCRGDDYLAFFDYSSVECPGARPTVVGRASCVEDGRVLYVSEVPWQKDVGPSTPDFSAHATVVEIHFSRAMAGMRELRVALLVVATDCEPAAALDFAAHFADHAAHLVICCRDLPETRPVQQHAAVLVAALKYFGCSLERLWSSEEVVVGKMKKFDGNHSDSDAEANFAALKEHDMLKRHQVRSGRRAAASSSHSFAELPKCKAKPWRDHAALLFFGTSTRSKDADARRCSKRRRWR